MSLKQIKVTGFYTVYWTRTWTSGKHFHKIANSDLKASWDNLFATV